MAEQSYTDSQIEELKRSNPFLDKSATEKYATYKSTDPFPKVGEALLNSADLLMYLLTVGIVEPFKVNNLKGVTYQCTFSGEAHYFNPNTKKMEEINLSDEKPLVLEKNSITYLKIEEKFHVPEYMVLRFNLSVSNAYKGLLLGTGPIIDPGFNGNLFIPLHNLTGNEYAIKKGAPLIRVEFTKLSRHADWGNKKVNLFSSLKPITKKTPQNENFSSFIEEALLDPVRKQFYTSGDVVSVRSSIPDMIADSAKKAEMAQKSAANASRAMENIGKLAGMLSIIGIITVIITVAGILHSSYSLVQDAHVRYDGIVQEIEACKQQICALTQQLEVTKEQLEQYKTAPSQGYEQSIERETSDQSNPLPPLSSGEADEGFDGP